MKNQKGEKPVAGRMQSLVIIGRDRICEHYGFGKDYLYTLIKAGAPVDKVGNRMAVVPSQFAEFMKRKLDRESK